MTRTCRSGFLFCPEVIARTWEPGGVSESDTQEATAVISAVRLAQLRALIQAGRKAEFYSWPEWRALRPDVLALDHHECVRCREIRRKFRRAKIVHHVKHLEDRPDLALSVWDPETGERQLVSVCKQCHEELHPESQRQFKNIRAPLTAERWD